MIINYCIFAALKKCGKFFIKLQKYIAKWKKLCYNMCNRYLPHNKRNYAAERWRKDA